jgi:hypothetical protein
MKLDEDEELVEWEGFGREDLAEVMVDMFWRFIDAYKKGLTGETAAWVVHKQKSHRSVSEAAMQALEARAKAK